MEEEKTEQNPLKRKISPRQQGKEEVRAAKSDFTANLSVCF